MYDGPVIDAFLHGPWIGGPGQVVRADAVPWTDDPRLQRVMRTFHHDGDAPLRSMAAVLADMDRNGVQQAVLAAKVYYPATADSLHSLHEEFARLAAESAGRLRWIATVMPPEHGSGSYWDLMQNPRIVQELAELPGLVGVHITPSPWGLAPNDRWYYPLYAKCVDLGLKLFTYVGMPAPLWPMGPNNPAHLEDVALAFPDLTILAHHIGDPWTDIAIRLAARHPNYYICTSAWFPKAWPAALMEFLGGRWHGTSGADKVVFASDYPLLDLDKTVAAARGLALPDAGLRKVLYENARSLLFQS
jgi:uncharacterized protein